MPRASRSKLSPWIEQLIGNYGSEEGNSGSGRLKAYVIGVGQVSQSQTQSCEGPTGLLFLSDGVLQIPAVLTASAWDNLQEQEDRECFTSLVNTTMCIQDYRLQFHMAPEQTKCRFYLSIGELATTAAGPVKDSTPCCTTVPSVRLKIVKTWRALLGVEDSQKSQCGGFDLSELLGEWQHDCLQAVLQDVRERLMVASSCPVSPQPSTSTFTPAPTLPDAVNATSWDIDRVRYKGGKHFSVPIRCLLVPEEDAPPLPTSLNVGSRTLSGLSHASKDSPQMCKPSNATQPSVDDAEWRIGMPAVTERGCDTKLNSTPYVEDYTLYEDMVAGMVESDIRPLSNPWDIFPPPCDTSSSSYSSPEATPTNSLHEPALATSKLDHPAIVTSKQLPVHNSKVCQQASECSFFPPYQKPPDSASTCANAASSASTNEHSAHAAEKNLPALEQESQMLANDVEEIVERTQRKRSEPTPKALTILVEEEAQVNASPPSWLFETQAGLGAEEDTGNKQGQTAGVVSRKTSTVHSDGTPFSYSYQVSGQNLQDFSRFKVDVSLLQWAVKILVPKQTDNPHMSGSSSQTLSASNKVT